MIGLFKPLYIIRWWVSMRKEVMYMIVLDLQKTYGALDRDI